MAIKAKTVEIVYAGTSYNVFLKKGEYTFVDGVSLSIDRAKNVQILIPSRKRWEHIGYLTSDGLQIGYAAIV